MDVVPPELLSHIISFSTLDGGSTAQSLLLASKTVHALTLPFLLQSLSCSGLSSIQRLTSILKSLKNNAERDGRKYIPPVKHLFLCDVSGKRASDADTFVPTPPESEDGEQLQERVDTPRVETSSDEIHSLLVAYTDLFDLLAPSLASLTFLAYNPSITPYRIIIDTYLPRLRYLSMRFTAIPYMRTYVPDVRPEGEADSEVLKHRLPELTHLHMGFTSKPMLSDVPLGFLQMTCERAPNLSEVKLTNVRFSDDCVQSLRKSLRLGRLVKSLQTPSTPSLVDIDATDTAESEQGTLQGQTDAASSTDDDSSTDVEEEEEDIPDTPWASLDSVYIQPARCTKDDIAHLDALGNLQILAYVSKSQCRSLGGKQGEEEGGKRTSLNILPTATVGVYKEWKERWAGEIASIPNLGSLYGERETEEDLLA
ncbi:hypothetical protein GLOTRDRAFT_97039 [Gloeophyllum trabeum ATCC 11539]|uniref:Uncharacterized protein n=1 Tax=Gloeophyllum trabeum (strain ATCC 11539 / FP-39264 / Madison 617) TaxID=670483 RepID=S7PSM5_GLOTA|nr:uncharacterized protein GLOTRDRAFT_97039 [Gloeophyllum trabeum ATCC 11539]EPQ50423.1 hypothetical protein GLOTRDRAFT_97039 [Gloeophyllum trabeum ATCC 11539]